MLKTFCFPAIYIKRIILLAFTILLIIQENISLSSVYAAPFSENELSFKRSDEDFLSDDITVISLNLLSKDASARFVYINEFISEYSPDILGFQETDQSFSSLLDELTVYPDANYGISDRYSSDDTSETNTAPILYNSHRFEAVAQNVHRYKNGSDISLLSWMILREKISRSCILVLNTKFSEKDPFSNARECVDITERIYQEFGRIPTILTGDLGVAQNDLAFRFLLNTFFDGASVSNQIHSSYNDRFDVGKHPTTENYPTDHIMLSKNDWNISRYSIIRNELTLKMSDHYPVMVTLESHPNSSEKHGYGSLKITNTIKRSVNGEPFEVIEILNTSSFPVDLYDYRLFYCGANTKEALLSTGADKVIQNMRISLLRGRYILRPNQTAIVWLVSAAHYTHHMPLITRGKDGTATYQTEIWKALFEDALVNIIPDDTLIVPLDRTSASYFNNGKTTNLKGNFYLNREKYEMLYITCDNALSVADALSYFYLSNVAYETTASKESSSSPPVFFETSSPPSANESRPEETRKPKETTRTPDHTSTPDEDSPTNPPNTEALAPSPEGYTFADVSGIQKLPKRDGEISIATILVILSSALVVVCFISIFVLYIRYERKYKKK